MTAEAQPLPTSAALKSYMRATGWEETLPQGSHGSLWSGKGTGFAVPHEDHNPAWIREVVGRLALAEGRTAEETAAAVLAHRAVAASALPVAGSPAPDPARTPADATAPSVPVSEAAVDAALGVVADFWKEAHAVLQCYPSRDLAKAMLQGAAPAIAEAAEARLTAVVTYCQERAHFAPIAKSILAIIGADELLSAVCTGPDCGQLFADSETSEYLFTSRERMERLLYADGWQADPVLCPACLEEAGS